MNLEMSTTTSLTSQHPPPAPARPSFLLKDSPDPAGPGGLYQGPYCSSSHKCQGLLPAPPRASWAGVGFKLLCAQSPKSGCTQGPGNRQVGTQENTSSRLAIAPARQTEILPSAYPLPCPNLPHSITTSLAPEESTLNPQPSRTSHGPANVARTHSLTLSRRRQLRAAAAFAGLPPASSWSSHTFQFCNPEAPSLPGPLGSPCSQLLLAAGTHESAQQLRSQWNRR